MAKGPVSSEGCPEDSVLVYTLYIVSTYTYIVCVWRAESVRYERSHKVTVLSSPLLLVTPELPKALTLSYASLKPRNIYIPHIKTSVSWRMRCCSVIRLRGEEHCDCSSGSQRCSNTLLWFVSRGLRIHLWTFFFSGIWPFALWSVTGRVPQLQCTRLGLYKYSVSSCFVSLKLITCCFTWCLPRLFLEESANNVTFSPASGCSGLYRLWSLPLQSWLIPPTVMRNPRLTSYYLL